jgi:hypothetical protein
MRVVQDIDRTDLESWRHPITITMDESRYTLVSPKPVDADHDPSRYDLFPTDTLKIDGKLFETYSTVSGWAQRLPWSGAGNESIAAQ